MPALIRPTLALSLAALTALAGCRKIASQPQCDQMLDRYVDLLVAETDAGADAQATTRARAKELAETDDDFRSCASKIETRQYDCAMKATTADAFEKCLE